MAEITRQFGFTGNAVQYGVVKSFFDKRPSRGMTIGKRNFQFGTIC